MSHLGSRIVAVLQTSLGFLLGLYSWWNLSSVYWRKDLELPVDSFLWLIICIAIGSLILVTLSTLFNRIMGERGWRLIMSSALTSAIGLSLVNFVTPAVFTLLGGESSIYFISDIGFEILATDTIFLLVIGLVLGTSVGLIALLANRLTSCRPLP